MKSKSPDFLVRFCMRFFVTDEFYINSGFTDDFLFTSSEKLAERLDGLRLGLEKEAVGEFIHLMISLLSTFSSLMEEFSVLVMPLFPLL